MLTDCCETFASRLIAIDCSQSKLLKDDLQSNIDTVNAICVKETLFFAYNRISRGGVYSLSHTHIQLVHPSPHTLVHNHNNPQLELKNSFVSNIFSEFFILHNSYGGHKWLEFYKFERSPCVLEQFPASTRTKTLEG